MNCDGNIDQLFVTKMINNILLQIEKNEIIVTMQLTAVVE